MMVIAKTGKGDIIGVTMFNLAITLSTWPFLLIPLMYLGQNDQFALSFNFLIPKETRSKSVNLTLKISSAILAGYAIIEACRTARLIFGVMLAAANITLKMLETIKEKYLREGQTESVNDYRRFYQIHSKSLQFVGDFVFVNYQFGSFLIVFGLSVAMVGWKFLSVDVYSVGTFLGTGTAFIMKLALDYATKSFGLSSGLIREWRKNLAEYPQGYRRK